VDKLIKIGSGSWGPNWSDPYQLVHTSGGMVKTASSGRFHPTIESFLATNTFDPNKIILVVTPMGAFEAWGSNVNGDGFLRGDLEPVNPNWGHASFKTYARAYQHHQNKDITKAFGHVACSVFDPIMQRVEVVFVIDREKAREVGASRVVQELDAGRRPDLSMGCKVAYDVCSICEQKSKSTLNYCHHLRMQMLTVLPDGRLVYAKNPKPRFFDLSFVLIRAAKEAAILQKVASETGVLPETSMAQLLDDHLASAPSGLEKAASSKTSSMKFAELEKRFPDVYYKVVKPMYDSEEPIDDGTLDRMSGFSLPKILASTAASGIVLRPREFQRVYLCRTGRPELADEYHQRGQIFRQCDSGGSGYHLRPDDISDGLLGLLRNWIPKRSALQPFVSKRIIVVSIRGPKKLEPETCEKSGTILDEVGQEYAKYVTGLAHLPSFLKSAMVRHSDLYDIFAAESFDPMKKVAGFGREVLLPAAAVVLPTYLLAAKWKGEEMRGRDLGMLRSMVAHHPTLTSVGLLTGFHRLGKI